MATQGMYYAGIDVGSLTAEGVILEAPPGHGARAARGARGAARRPGARGSGAGAGDGADLRASARIAARANPLESAREILVRLERESGLRRSQLTRTVSTGYGREAIQAAGLAQHNVSEISCHGYGAWCLVPELRTVIDIGGQDAKAIRVGPAGELEDFAMNDKCAAGTGHFLELMSRTLEVELADLGRLAFGARRPVRMSSRCSIFVETEVIHFRQQGRSRADIAAGVADAMAERVAALARRISPRPAVTLTGGVAKNHAVRRELERRLGLRMVELSFDPQLVGAYGAACLARDGDGDGGRDPAPAPAPAPAPGARAATATGGNP